MKTTLVVALAVGAAAITSPVGAPSAGAAPPKVVDLGVELVARDLNDRGVVVGNADRAGSTMFRWKDGRLVLFGDLGVAADRPVAVNRPGAMAVWTSFDESLLWDAGKVTELGSLSRPANETLAADINDHGAIVGSSVKGSEWHAFLWERGRIRDLGTAGGTSSSAVSINNLGAVVGLSNRANGRSRLVVWQDGKVRDLGTLGQRAVYPAQINDRGQIVGSVETAPNVFRAFIWTAGVLTVLPPLPGDTSCSAASVNDAGAIVGNCFGDDGVTQAVRWVGGRPAALPDLGGGIAEAVAINESGVIAGNANDPQGGYHAVIWTP